LIFAGESGFSRSYAVRLERLALDREILALICYYEIAFSATVVVIGLMDILEQGIRKVHFPQFVFRDITEHQAAHTRVLPDDFGKFPFRQVPSLQYAFTLFWRHSVPSDNQLWSLNSTYTRKTDGILSDSDFLSSLIRRRRSEQPKSRHSSRSMPAPRILKLPLADLYDPVAMPPDLRKAHQALDKAVDAAYGKKTFASDAERVAFLFGLYRKYTSLLPGPEMVKRKRNWTNK